MVEKTYHLRIKLSEFQAAVRSALQGNVASLRLRITLHDHLIHLTGCGPWRNQPRFSEPSQEPVFASYVEVSDMLGDRPEYGIKGQTIVHLIVSRSQPEKIDAILWIDGEPRPLDLLHLLGPGMIRLHPSSELDRNGVGRSKRTIRIAGIQGESQKTWHSTFVLVGAGSGGSCLGFQLASQNPESIVVVDPDRVTVPNLINMPHASPADAKRRRPKAHLLIRAIHENSPRILLQGVAKRIQDKKVMEFVRRRDPVAIFSFVDDVAGHLASSFLAAHLLIPHVAIGTLVTRNAGTGRVMQQADIRLLEPGSGCVRCAPYMEDAEYSSALYEVRRPAGAMRRGERRDWQANGRIGSSLSLNQIAAGMGVDLLARYFRGEVTTSTWIRYLIGPSGTPELWESPTSADPRCRHCKPST